VQKGNIWHTASSQIVVLTEEQHACCGLAQIFLVVLRARGRTAGGAASCPGLGDLGWGGMECDSSVHPPLSAWFYAMKQRIYLGFAPIFILFVGIGLYALWLFSRVGGAVDVILQENYQRVRAGQAMKESAERMDSALSLALAGEEERGRKLFESSTPVFEEHLRRTRGSISLPGEGEAAGKIKQAEERYQVLAKKFWNSSDLGTRRTLYFSELLPLFTQIQNNLQEVIRISEDNMVQADHRARTLSANSTRTMFLVLVVGAGIALLLVLATQRAILKPIQILTAVAKELGSGNLDQVAAVQSDDEIGALAAAFNKLSSKLRAYRQITADQILQARQMTEITFSAFPDAILALSVDGKINFANPAAGELLKRLDSQGGLPLPIQEEAENVLRGAPDYMPTSFEKAAPVRINDHEAFLLPRVIGMRDESGNLFGAAVVLQDVTRFRLLDEVKTNLVSTVSHELKTPLSSVRMGLHLLLEEKIAPLNAKQLELLLAAREDSERLLRMINDLLDLARLESGQTRQRFEIISPRTLIKNAAPNLKPLVEANDARLVTNIAPELPDVAVDLRQIGHVFSNLVSNAARHSKPGEDVVLSAKPIGKSVRFSVLDHGPGIPKEFQSRIFERFFRIPGTEDSTGVGLGLAIAREMIVSHGGSIGLQSTSGKGSEFYFDLPATSNGVKA
jgi:NtrC-family two-component system sensor histidine kinase KinB